MAAATPLIIPEKSQEAIITFQRQCYNMLNQQWNIRGQMRQRDLAYIRENDFTKENWRARLSNAYGDPTKFQNVTVPVVMPQVEAAVTYQSSVFLTGEPLFEFVAPPDQVDAALQFNTLMENHATRGGWVQEFMMFFRDCFKYNLGAVEVSWERQASFAVETDLAFTGGKEGKPKEIIWEGNKIKRWDLYNTFWDTRVAPTEIYKNGEFAGKTELMSRIQLKKFINELPDKMVSNIVKAFESGLGSQGTIGASGIESYYTPQINPDTLLAIDPKRSMDWLAWASILDKPQPIQYRNLYEVTTLYARILPSDFNLRVPSANTPQIWKFIIVNHQVLIYAERQTNAHNYLPIFFGQPNNDGLWYQTKSLADNAKPFQEIASALVNSAMAARRRAISDRTLYDPSRVSEAHINSDNPSAKIPVRPAAYGKPVGEAVYPFPFRDDQSQVAFQELPQILQMANTVNGQNQAKQGQFVKGNKTQHEFDTVMGNANGRDQMTAMMLESQVFTPIKEVLKTNILQYQSAGTIYSTSKDQQVKIDPIALRKSAATFKLSDGLTPADKLIGADEWQVALQTIGSSPQIGGQYNIGPMFSYLMKSRNIELKEFEKTPAQVAYEQAMAQWQQAFSSIHELMKTVTMKIEGVTMDSVQNMIKSLVPPQPTPQQFGYTPGQGDGDSDEDDSGNSSQQSPLSLGALNGQSNQ
jgi:hypothetical protein